MIVKLQLPLSTNTLPTILVYNKSRSVEGQFAVTPEWLKWFGSRLKIYASAHFLGTELIVDRKVTDRTW
jgi:hypothetical protein